RERPPGERARRLDDVLLRVVRDAVLVEDAGREQLHELAREVLVRRVLLVRVVVEPHDHRGVPAHLEDEVLETSQAELPQGAVLLVHPLEGADLVDRRGEVIVEEERQLLDERTRRGPHPLEPPRLHRAERLEPLLRRLVRVLVPLEQRADGLRPPLPERLRDLLLRGGESRAPEEVRGVLGVPLDRHASRPRGAGGSLPWIGRRGAPMKHEPAGFVASRAPDVSSGRREGASAGPRPSGRMRRWNVNDTRTGCGRCSTIGRGPGARTPWRRPTAPRPGRPSTVCRSARTPGSSPWAVGPAPPCAGRPSGLRRGRRWASTSPPRWSSTRAPSPPGSRTSSSTGAS